MTATQLTVPVLVDEVNEILVVSAGLAPADLVADGSATLEELGLDSLAAMELQAVLDTRHGVAIPDDAVGLTVLAIAECVLRGADLEQAA